MTNKPEAAALTSIAGEKAALDYQRQPSASINELPASDDRPVLAERDDLPALEDPLAPGQLQENALLPASSNAKNSGEKATTPKDGGTPRSKRSSKDAQGTMQGSIKGNEGAPGSFKENKDALGSLKDSKVAENSIKGSKDERGSINGRKDAQGSIKGSIGEQGSIRENKLASESVKEDNDAAGSVKESKAAPDSKKGSVGGEGSMKRSKGASGSVKGSNEAEGAMTNKDATGSIKGSKAAADSLEGCKDALVPLKDNKDAEGAVKDTKDAPESIKGSKGAQGGIKDKGATGSLKGSKDARDSIKATKGTNSELDSRNEAISEKDMPHSSSKDNLAVADKVPMSEAFDEAEFPLLEEAPVPTSPPAKPDRKNLVVIGVAVFVVIIALLVIMMLTGGSGTQTHGVTTTTCESEHCDKVAKMLLDSVAPDVDPCDNFYLRVCGGWKYAETQGEVLFHKLVKDATSMIQAATVPQTGQSPSEKAALAYQACEDIVAKNNTNLTTVLQILEEAGFYSPPGWTGPVDALNATFYLHFRWRIAAPIKFTYVRPVKRGITLRMAPSDSLKAYARRRSEPGFYDALRSDYEMFQTMFEQNRLPNLTYDDWRKIDRIIITDSMDVLREPNSTQGFAGWNESTIQNAIRGVSKRQWTRILNMYLNRSDALRFYVDSLTLFKKFMEMPNDIGLSMAQVYYRWYIAEILTRRMYAPWIVKDFPTYKDALRYHRGFCFGMVHQTASYALLARYVKNYFDADVKNDIIQLLKMVRAAYNDVFSEGLNMRSTLDMLPTYANGTGRLFDRLTLSNETYMEESYAAYEDMTSDPLQNWRRLMIGRSRTLWTRVSMGMASGLPTDLLYYEIDGVSNDIILRPDVAVLPAYDSGAPLLLKLASLGSLMASAMAKVLYGAQEFTARWHATAHCISSLQEPSYAKDGEIIVLERVIALTVTVLAAMTATKNDEPLTIPGIPDLSGMQFLFAIWCYQQCGEKEGERLCNEPLKEVIAFADAFQCAANTTMRRQGACSAGWFKPLRLTRAMPKVTAGPDTTTLPDNSTQTGDTMHSGGTT